MLDEQGDDINKDRNWWRRQYRARQVEVQDVGAAGGDSKQQLRRNESRRAHRYVVQCEAPADEADVDIAWDICALRSEEEVTTAQMPPCPAILP